MAQPTLQDLVRGITFTGSPDVTGSALDQLVDSSYVASDKGLVVTTTDTGLVPEVPDPTAGDDEEKWERYLWRRIGTSSVTIYTWNPAATSDATYLKWQAVTVAAIGAGYITTSMLADDSVTDDKIVSLAYSKLTGAPAQWYQLGSNTAGGDLTGTYPNPTIAALAVDYTKMAALTIRSSVISDADTAVAGSGISLGKLYPHTVGLYKPRTNAGATAWEWVAPTMFDALTTTGAALQVPRMNSGGTALEWVTISGTSGGLIKTYSETFVLTAGTQVYTTAAHNLGGTPNEFKIYLLALNTTYGYAIGDLIEIEAAVVNATTGPYFWAWSPVAGTTLKIAKHTGSVNIRQADGTVDSGVADATFVAAFSLVIKATRYQ